MLIKRLFIFVSVLLLTAFLTNAQQIGLYPLSQYSVGTQTNVQLRTTTIVQKDTLKIPYIEDFSGAGLPIDSISVDTIQSTPKQLVYRITHLKLHGLKSGDSIRVLNATGGIPTSKAINGLRYVKVINKYAFQLFDNRALDVPSAVLSGRMLYCNWFRSGAPVYSTTPDTLGFFNNNGGVFINNDMALNPISIGVATFDGVNYKGIPYATSPIKGYGDSLVSLPFNLSSYTPASNIYMSFYWQSKSLGDSPLSSEFLSLEFYTASGSWVKVWSQGGSTVTQDTFLMAMVPITASSYLHKGFKYRFRSYGVLNGRFNVWNLDYIYINSGRSAGEAPLKDISIITTNKNALKNYTSVPYKHIKNLPDSVITSETDSAFMKIRDNLNDYTTTQVDAILRQHLVRDNAGHDTIKYEPINSFNEQRYVFTQTFTNIIPGVYMNAPYVLKEEFYYQNPDTVDRIDLTFNNFAAIETYFYDYYSYDDGTPETSFFTTNPGGTKVSVGYKILKADQLTHIDYCFIKNNGTDLTNSVIMMSVWKQKDGDTIPEIGDMYHQQISIKYSADINGFVRYALTTPLLLDSGATYYFGYTQNFTNALFLGYDKNNNHLKSIYFCNDGNNWQPFRDISTVPGSLMIRPVFSDNEIITGIDSEQTTENQFTFYPNPAKSELHFTGQPEYISVYDLSGLLLLEKKIEDDEALLSTDSLQNGLYIMILSKGTYNEVKRLVIQK